MRPRSDFYNILSSLFPNAKVYHQNPPNTGMVYPCVLYFKVSENSKFADNNPYFRTNRWNVTYITSDPKDFRGDVLGDLEMSRFDRVYKTNNLYHYVYIVYF